MTTAKRNKNANKILTAIEYKYCLKKFLDNSIWYESSKPEKIAETPFAVNIIDNIKIEDKSPPLGLFWISSKIELKNTWVSLGIKNSIYVNNVWSKFWIEKKGIRSIKGIKFKIKRIKGKRAMKKLNEMLPDLDDKVPFTIPIIYILNIS